MENRIRFDSLWARQMTSEEHFPIRRAAVATIVYLLVYFVASYLDLRTTALALEASGAHEGNVFATNSQAYVSARAWAITVAAAIFMAGCVVFAVRYASRVE